MRITHVVRYDAGLYRGGGEIKAERTRDALARAGVEVRVHDPLSDDLGDLVHFFGSMGYYWTLAEYARRRGVPYVCSPIFVTPRSESRLRWRAFRQKYIQLQRQSNLSKLFRGARELYFQTRKELENTRAYYGRAIGASAIVPNGVEERFARGDAEAFRKEFGVPGPFVLQASVFGPNKHQLELIRAMSGLSWDLVLLGREGDAEYAEACRRAAGPNVRFLGALPHDDPRLAGAYAAAEVFCLPSSDDIFANSAMEAAVAGCKLVLGDAWGGQEIYGQWAKWVRPGDVRQIRRAFAEWAHTGHDPAAQSKHFLEHYSWDAVAAQLKTRYESVLKRA